MTPLARALRDAKTLQALIGALLCERRVVLVSASVEKLSDCAHACVALLQPFEWQHVFIPLLPARLLSYACVPCHCCRAHASADPTARYSQHRYACAPMPFIIGVPAERLEERHARSWLGGGRRAQRPRAARDQRPRHRPRAGALEDARIVLEQQLQHDAGRAQPLVVLVVGLERELLLAQREPQRGRLARAQHSLVRQHVQVLAARTALDDAVARRRRGGAVGGGRRAKVERGVLVGEAREDEPPGC